jgi:hypothetical protein
MPTAGQQLFPLSSDFTLLGHYWWALLLGYCAGYLARFIYIRRTNEKSANPPTK